MVHRLWWSLPSTVWIRWDERWSHENHSNMEVTYSFEAFKLNKVGSANGIEWRASIIWNSYGHATLYSVTTLCMYWMRLKRNYRQASVDYHNLIILIFVFYRPCKTISLHFKVICCSHDAYLNNSRKASKNSWHESAYSMVRQRFVSFGSVFRNSEARLPWFPSQWILRVCVHTGSSS